MDAKTTRKIKKLVRKTKIYLVLIVVVLGGAGFYLFTQYQNFETVQANIQTLDELKLDLENQLQVLKGAYPDLKSEHENQVVSVDRDFEAVFPSTEDYKGLARFFENYFNDHNISSDPFILSSIQFGTPIIPRIKSETSKGATLGKQRGKIVVEQSPYAVLPVTISFRCSEEKSIEFFDFIQNSGSLTDRTRLMSAESFQYDLQKDEEKIKSGEDDGLKGYSLSIKAYFQKSMLDDEITKK